MSLLLLVVLATSLLGCAGLRAGRLYLDGTAALDRGDAARAVVELEEAARLRPSASEIQNHLGLAYAASGRSADALQAWERAVELDCNNQAALANLAAARQRGAPVKP